MKQCVVYTKDKNNKRQYLWFPFGTLFSAVTEDINEATKLSQKRAINWVKEFRSSGIMAYALDIKADRLIHINYKVKER